MEPLTLVGAVRLRPGMYVGNTGGEGLLTLVLELVANGYDQYLAGRCSRIAIELGADGTIVIEDDGPGLAAQGGGGVPALDVLLSRYSYRPTVDGHRPHVHLGLGGMGLFVVNALSERFEIVTVRDGVEARALYARGEVIEPLVTTATHRANGTTIRFRPDPIIFQHVRVPRAELARALEDLTFLSPGLTLQWKIAGDAVAAAGLAGLVAVRVPCALSEVASHRASYETPKGPIEVEVALAWRSCLGKPAIDSFVNLARTRGHGSHVAGLLDGVRAFVGEARPQDMAGLVAAVAVVLADVKYGAPTKDRLESSEARGSVADATQKAMHAWAAAHPEVRVPCRG